MPRDQLRTPVYLTQQLNSEKIKIMFVQDALVVRLRPDFHGARKISRRSIRWKVTLCRPIKNIFLSLCSHCFPRMLTLNSFEDGGRIFLPFSSHEYYTRNIILPQLYRQHKHSEYEQVYNNSV